MSSDFTYESDYEVHLSDGSIFPNPVRAINEDMAIEVVFEDNIHWLESKKLKPVRAVKLEEKDIKKNA